MPARKKRHIFTIKTEAVEGMGIRALMDMLRYDQAVVLGSDRGVYRFENANGPTVGRWASFGIPIEEQYHGY